MDDRGHGQARRHGGAVSRGQSSQCSDITATRSQVVHGGGLSRNVSCFTYSQPSSTGQRTPARKRRIPKKFEECEVDLPHLIVSSGEEDSDKDSDKGSDNVVSDNSEANVSVNS